MKISTALLILAAFLVGCEKTTTTTEAVVKAKPQPPIMAQSTLMKYPGKSIGFEGKLYNPNSFPLTNIRVRWHVYKTPLEKDAEVWSRFGFEEFCEVEFAFIPPATTYDFKTNKIKYRDEEVVSSMGMLSAPMTDLKPQITFSP